jgi:UDPglucose 6-dehydrogenase
LSFKPNTDDIRDATSLVIIDHVLRAGAKIKAYDPVAQEAMQKVYPSIQYCRDAYEAASGADCLVVVTEWNEFRELDLAKLKSLLRSAKLMDCRNVYDPAEMRKLGFDYAGVGRGHILKV